MAKYQRGERITIHVDRQESNFDRASESAIRMALERFGVDEAGYVASVDVERSEASIVVKFVGYQASGGMGGWSHVYIFEAWVE